MENPITIIIGLKYLYKYLKEELYNNEKIIKASCLLFLFAYFFSVYNLFYPTDTLNLFNYKIGVFLFCIYVSPVYFLIHIVLVELGIAKKHTLNTRFVKITKQLFESSKKKHHKSDQLKSFSLDNRDIFLDLKKKQKDDYSTINQKFKKLKTVSSEQTQKILNIEEKQEKNSIEINNKYDELKKSFTDNKTRIIENIKIDVLKNKKDIKKLNNEVFKPKIIKTHSKQGIKKLFMEYKNDLFENLEVRNFIGFLFEDPHKFSKQKTELKETEKENILSIIILLLQNNKIVANESLIYKLLDEYMTLNFTRRTLNNRLKKNYTSLMKYEYLQSLKIKISKLSNNP